MLMVVVVWLVFILLGWLTLPRLYKRKWYRELAAAAAITAVNLFLFTWLAWGKSVPMIDTAITTFIKGLL